MKSLENIKRRINSIQSTSKITNAMKLVATSKLKKQKDLYALVANFSSEFYSIMGDILNCFSNLNFANNKSSSNKKLFIVITSTLGLCGAYNINICKKVVEEMCNNDDLMIIGQRGISFFKTRGYSKNIIKTYLFDDNDFDYMDTIGISDFINESFIQGKYESIRLAYTKFINSLTFNPLIISLLPLDKTLLPTRNDISKSVIEFEPSKESIVKTILPIFISSILYAAIIESKVSENGARRNAMDTATENANEIIENLILEFNRIRQENITQEINEIVAGADSNE